MCPRIPFCIHFRALRLYFANKVKNCVTHITMTLMSRTEGDYYDMEQPVITGTKMTTDYGWGFCTNECAQEKGRNTHTNHILKL